MSIFQKSVINKYLENLDKGQVEKAYQKFIENYNSVKIAKIRNLKEEEYQDGFLRDVFVDVFGYILNPDDDFNLAREFKNIADSKKADGAILKDGKAVAVIELKSTKTKDLKSVTEQAFGYKHNQPDCKYVIISNFQKLQFYIDYANEYEEFDLFNLQKDEFELLYLLLNSESIFSDLPLKLKTETKFHEENISDKLYKDYSIFKRKLYENLIENNPGYDKLTLFKKSQKLLDRFLFILFAEDSGLLPPNSITRVIETFNKLEELDAYKPIYEIYKQYFGYMNIGRKGKTEADKIPAYNGGLFYPDELLDNLIIDDDILISDLLKLSEYDFNTEVDVNILGHIFEHSLNEIEEITAEIAATAATRGHVPLALSTSTAKPTTSKRKKDGVFYTPKYITQYIVENTVGTLCKEKRQEFGIAEIEIDISYYKKAGKKPMGLIPLSEKGKKLFETLEKYKEWLLTIKIVDPACGSGAFLNQALNFLIAEHKSIDDIIAELTNTPLRLFDTEKSILENNLYGVDINEESVEIAKLSLWLRTARKDRKLSNLNNNIKCGNSLIDDPEVAGDKAFNWNEEFPQIFKEKIKQTWHITTATHNSRYSQRMFDYHIKIGEAVWIDEKDEIIITEAIAEIVKEDNLNVIEYNICGDHMHMLLVCEKEEITKIVGKIKGKSSRLYHSNKGINPLVRLDGESSVPLWTQKFGSARIDSEEYLLNAINYIRNNRIKHELPENKELIKIIDGMICTTEHAFHPEYNGGFDVVIGNPPYVQSHSIDELEKQYIYDNYRTAEYQINTYGIFVEKFLSLLKNKHYYSLIIPNYWLSTKYDRLLRKEVFIKNHAIEVTNTFEVFEQATVDTLILTGTKDKNKVKETCVNSISKTHNSIEKRLNAINLHSWEYSEIIKFHNNDEDVKINFEKGIKLNGDNTLKSFLLFKKGMQPYEKGKGNPPQTRKMMGDKIYHSDSKIDDTYLPLLGAKHIKRHYLVPFEKYIKYGKNLAASRNPDIFTGERILINRILSKGTIDGVLLTESYINNTDVFNLIPTQNKSITIKVLYALIVSKLCATYFKKANINLNRNAFPKINVNTLETFPIPDISKAKQEAIEIMIDSLLKKTSQFQQKKNEFLSRVKDNFVATAATRGLIPLAVRITKKIGAFNNYNFKTFIAELKKQKVNISLTEQVEWEEFFNSYKTEINYLQSVIDKTDKEIDQMIYELYGLSEEEIRIVEGAV